MKKTKIKNNVYSLGMLIVFLGFFASSCVTDEQFWYLNDQVTNLNSSVEALQESTASKADSNSEEELKNEIDAKFVSITSDMRVELDQLKDDIREMSGRLEDNEHLLKRTVEGDTSEQDHVRAELQKLAELQVRVDSMDSILRQHQAYLNLDSTTKIDTKPGPLPGNLSKPSIATIDEGSTETGLYESSYALFKAEKYEQANSSFRKFLNVYPQSDLADNAQFWIGECFMGLKQYEQAILAYQEVIKNYPKANKVTNAMLRQAIAFLEIKDKTSSKLLLKRIIQKYPKSSEAKIAQTKLDSLK